MRSAEGCNEEREVGLHRLIISCLGMIYEYPSISGSRERDSTGNVMTKRVIRWVSEISSRRLSNAEAGSPWQHLR